MRQALPSALEWQRALDLRKAGREWCGPCPACGGHDRFHVAEKDGRALVGCRGCIDGLAEDHRRKRFGEIVQIVFPDDSRETRTTRSTQPKTNESPGPPDGSRENPYGRRDSEALSMVLDQLYMDVRFNLRSRRIEWRGYSAHGFDDGLWHAVTRRSLSGLRERIARQFFVHTREGPKPLAWGRDAFTDTLDALVLHREIDPLVDWLDNLPAWDGTERLCLLLPTVFDVPLDELSMWASSYLVIGVIQRTMQPGCKLDEIPVLIGPQDIGKSALLRCLLPPDMPDLFGDGLRWDASDKVMVEAVTGRAIVEVSEMAGRRRAEIEHIKSFVSRQDDGHVRLSYALSPEPLPRRFILVGTTNNETDLPNDPSGNRRFVPIPATVNKVGSVEAFMEHNRLQLWAEGMARYTEEDARANLPRAMKDVQRERAELHRDRDDVIEDAIDNLPGDGPYTIARILEMLDTDARGATPHRVGRALKNAGWTLRRTRTERRWVREPPSMV